jgi:hypothetical protein
MIDPMPFLAGRHLVGSQLRDPQQQTQIHIMSNNTKITKMVDDYAQLNAQLKVLGELVDAAKAKIIALGDGSYNGTAHKVVVSTSIPVRFDSAAFKEAHPSLYESFKAQGNAVTSARIHGR